MYNFHKFQGTGNDFIIFHEADVAGLNYTNLAQQVCDRHFGIGADGMMVVATSQVADIGMLFYNADGTVATMCGNGIRCFAKYVFDQKLISLEQFTVETLAGIMNVEVMDSQPHVSQIRVNLGKPVYEGEAIPKGVAGPYFNQPLTIKGKTYNINTLIIGTIHTVIFVEDLNQVNVAEVGPLIENHDLFPLKTNVNFCEIVDRKTLRVSTWEKGVGQTLACGTGVTASAIVSSERFECDSVMEVGVAGGTLLIEKIDDAFYMTGPATLICSGVYNFV
ncbi:MAG TPA: diaminopimelate epimerase [Firmicutes bacterium]|nr:diaminopimelate epimerase [Bacillota bacterium]